MGCCQSYNERGYLLATPIVESNEQVHDVPVKVNEQVHDEPVKVKEQVNVSFIQIILVNMKMKEKTKGFQ